MKLSTQVRYGTRALFYIAFHRGGSFTQVKEIAEKEGISPRYLEQIFQKFKKKGIVGSIRGPKGGYYLIKRPEDIKLGDIIRAVKDSDLFLVFCIDPSKRSKKPCSREKQCPVKDIWKESSNLLMSYFDSITLADICKKALEMGLERKIEKELTYQI